MANIIEIIKHLPRLFYYNITSEYNFKLSDLKLHINEKNWHIPEVKIHFADNYFNKLAINEELFFWPKEFKTDGLAWLYNEIYYPFERNPASYSNPLTKVPVNGWVMDAGCCEGFFSIYSLKNGASKVIGIEPMPLLCESLKLTLSEEIINNKFILCEAGLAERQGEMELKSSDNTPWESSVINLNKNIATLKIPVDTIDNIISHNNIVGPGLIKMDIEGAEMNALKGATKTLKNLKPKLAIAVYHNYLNAKECAEIIKSTNPIYQIEFRGYYGWNTPPRPYLLFAY